MFMFIPLALCLLLQPSAFALAHLLYTLGRQKELSIYCIYNGFILGDSLMTLHFFFS